MRNARESVKFMQVCGQKTWRRLQLEAKKRDITVQELLRSVVIPDWLVKYNQYLHDLKQPRFFKGMARNPPKRRTLNTA